ASARPRSSDRSRTSTAASTSVPGRWCRCSAPCFATRSSCAGDCGRVSNSSASCASGERRGGRFASRRPPLPRARKRAGSIEPILSGDEDGRLLAAERRARIALVGQSVVDRVTLPGQPVVERLGGAPIFAGQAVVAAGVAAVILTRGATPALRRPLRELGLPIIEKEAPRSCISEMTLYLDGSCADSFAALGIPFTPADVTGWMAP